MTRIDTAGKEWCGKRLGWQAVRRYVPGLCTCGAKNPDPVWHRSNCPVSTQRYPDPYEEPPIEQSPAVKPNPPNWPFDISYDFAEWMTAHTVVKLSKHVDEQTGVVSTIFHADAGGCYAYDAFEVRWHGPDITFTTATSGDALLRLGTSVLQWMRHAREIARAKLDAITL